MKYSFETCYAGSMRAIKNKLFSHEYSLWRLKNNNIHRNFYQVMRVMKITMVLMTCLLVQLSASTYAQRITISKHNVSIHAVLEEIRKQTNYDFFYNLDIFKDARPVVVQVKNASLDQVLNACFANQPYTFVIEERSVIITKKPAKALPNYVKQQAKITGRVIRASDGRPLSGVSIRAKGAQNATSSDTNGAFSISIPTGGATLVFTFLGLQTREVSVGLSNTNITVSMNEATSQLQEVAVIVQARRRTNTEASVLEERKKASIVQDAISAQQIQRTGSITTTQALQRVTGVTVTDDKYVAIRGLGDRSVIGQLNGARLASSDPDRSAIPLDLVPASLLDNITIYKTVTPDKPADAASGIVELKTKSVPDKMTLEFIAQTGLNSNIGLGGKYNSFWNSDMGFLGTKINNKNLSQDFLNLSKQYPNGLSDIQKLIGNSTFNPQALPEVNRINGIMQGFDPVMRSSFRTAPLNQLYSATFGNSYTVFGKHKLGVILGANYYRRTTDINGGDLTQYSIYQGVVTGSNDIYSRRHIPSYISPNSLYMGKYQTYKENTGSEQLNYGTLAGLTYRFNPQHEISLQYLGSWGAESQAVNMNGSYQYSGLPGEVSSYIYSLKQTFRKLNTINLQGEHKLLKHPNSPKLSYNLATSKSGQNNPDFRFINLIDYQPRELKDRYVMLEKPDVPRLQYERRYTDHKYALNSGYVSGFGLYGLIQAEPNGRRWRTLDETNHNYKADLSFPFDLLGLKQEFKTGYNYLSRDRKYGENMLLLPGSNFVTRSKHHLYDVYGDVDRLVSNEVIGIRPLTGTTPEGDIPVGGFLYNSQKSPNNYTGFLETDAFYGMLDLKITDKLRVAGGVRFEKTNIQSSVDTSNIFIDPSLTQPDQNGNVQLLPVFTNPNTVYKTGFKPYYSFNTTYALNEKVNIRAAFNTTLARPELREITNVFEFDAFQMGLVVGNPKLINQSTQNLDFRMEWFPNPGEVLAISAFGKRIKNQLVKVFSLNTAGTSSIFPEFPTIRFENDPNIGQVWGLELEVVKDLGLVWDPARHFFAGTNLLLAQSDIKKSPERLLANHLLDQNSPNNSPLFEQAPYSINAWLNYDNKKWGLDITATFNVVGERLVQINLTGEPDLYTRPEPTLDLVLSQRINKRILFKGYTKNLLNPAVKTVYANPGTGGKWYGNEYINRSYHRGMEIMMGFTYNLF